MARGLELAMAAEDPAFFSNKEQGAISGCASVALPLSDSDGHVDPRIAGCLTQTVRSQAGYLERGLQVG
jgi:hypothetical protein